MEDLAKIPTAGGAGLFYGTDAYASAVGVPESTVRRLCRRGEIPATKVGKTWRIPVWVLEMQLAAGAETKDDPSTTVTKRA